MSDVLLGRIKSLERRLHAAQVRANYWRQRADARREGICVGCGGAWDDYTPGCRRCTYRQSKRRAVAA